MKCNIKNSSGQALTEMVLISGIIALLLYGIAFLGKSGDIGIASLIAARNKLSVRTIENGKNDMVDDYFSETPNLARFRTAYDERFFIPNGATVLHEGDILWVLAGKGDLKKMHRILGRAAV